jgi:hypothetical protein
MEDRMPWQNDHGKQAMRAHQSFHTFLVAACTSLHQLVQVRKAWPVASQKAKSLSPKSQVTRGHDKSGKLQQVVKCSGSWTYRMI